MKSELLIRMLACLDPMWFRHSVHSQEKANHKKAATSSASIHKNWFDSVQNEDPEGSFSHLAPLVNDVFELQDRVSYSLKHDNLSDIPGNFRANKMYRIWLASKEKQLTHFNAGEIGLDLPNPALIMILGAFRSNVWLAKDENGDPCFIGWLVDPAELWEETKCDFLSRLVNDFSDADGEPSQFIKRSGPYDHQLIEISYGRRAPNHPAIFHSMDGNQYRHDEKGSIGLQCDTECYCSLVESSDELASISNDFRYSLSE